MAEGEIAIRGELVGFDAMIAQVANQLMQAVDNDIDALHDSLQELMEEIKQEYVPVDTGALRDSGFVSDPIVNGNEISISMGFTEEYALVQHERLDYYHSHGQAKYLEVPLEQFVSRTQ